MDDRERQGHAPPDAGALIAYLPDAVAIIDGGGGIVWGNPAAERLFGETAADLVGTNVLDLVHPEDADVTITSLDSVRGKEIGTPLEIRVRTDRGWKLVEVIGSNQLDEPAIGGLVLCIRDLTERRRWEVASDETSRFRALVHNASTVLMLLDRAGRVGSVSAAITRILGHDQELLEGHLLSHFVHEDDRDRLDTAIEQALDVPERGIGSTTVELDMLHANADLLIPFELNIVNLLDDPTVAGLVVSGHDISRLRASLAQLEEAHSQLVRRERLSALGEMASMIGHELRNPLNAVLNGIFLLRQDLKDLAPEPEQLFTMVEQQAGLAVQLAEEVTAYMRQREPELVRLDLSTVVEDVIDATPPPAGIQVKRALSVRDVTADAVQLAQILTNLLTNAYQAMPDGGSIKISASEEGPWVVIVVEDDGEGIDPGTRDRLFEPFFSSKPQGTGLGLAIVRRLVEAHRGDISLDRRPEGGSAATLRLPADPQEQ